MIPQPMMKSWAEAKEIYSPNNDSVMGKGHSTPDLFGSPSPFSHWRRTLNLWLTKASQKLILSMRPEATADKSISPPAFMFQCDFGSVRNRRKRSQKPLVITRRSASSSKERRSCILKTNLFCWKRATHGSYQRARTTLIK